MNLSRCSSIGIRHARRAISQGHPIQSIVDILCRPGDRLRMYTHHPHRKRRDGCATRGPIESIS